MSFNTECSASKVTELGKSQCRKPVLHGHNRALLNTPVQINPDGSIPFCSFHSILVPELGGVYLIHDLRGVLYVGRSNNLQRRLEEHYLIAENELLLRARRNPFGEMSFTWILADEEGARASLEHRLVAWLQPPCNRVIPANSH